MGRSQGKRTKTKSARKGASAKKNLLHGPSATRTPSITQKQGESKGLAASPLNDFFAKYSAFEYNATNSASHEFYRLCDESGWEREDDVRDEAHEDFKDALVKQFNLLYGTDNDRLSNWQILCRIIRIVPVPQNLNACREAVRSAHVNIVDLIDTKTTGKDVQVFGTEVALSEYTMKSGKYFPKESACAGGLLRYLLRRILHPRTERISRRRTRGRR